jgi:hypothetical protein
MTVAEEGASGQEGRKHREVHGDFPTLLVPQIQCHPRKQEPQRSLEAKSSWPMPELIAQLQDTRETQDRWLCSVRSEQGSEK